MKNMMPSPARYRRTAMVALGVLWHLGCGSGEPERLIRLADRLSAESIIESPLLSAGEIGELPTRLLWRSAFDRQSLQQLGWHVAPGDRGALRVRQDADHGEVACYSGRRWRQYPILIAAKPLSRYRMTVLRWTDWPELDLTVNESTVNLARPDEVNNVADLQRLIKGKLATKSSTPASHALSPAVERQIWERVSVDFTTGLATKSLALVFSRPNDASRAGSGETCLAEVLIESVETTIEQELALLKGAFLAPGHHGLGVAKRGRLLPLPRTRAADPPYDDNYDYRDVLFAPAPTRLLFRVGVPAGGRLTFGYALAIGSQVGDQARFAVEIDGEELLAREVSIGAGGDGWHWREAELDLSPWAGGEIELELLTSSSTPRGFALWGGPIVDAPRPPGDKPNVLLIGIDTLRADRLSAYGYHRPTSPQLERLAADGVLFERAISASNWTAPAFASIFSGLAPARHGVVNQHFGLAPGIETLAEHFRAGGWRTHAIVYKAFLFGLGFDQGFDRWFNLPTSQRTAQQNIDKALGWLDNHHDRRFFLFVHLDDPHQPFNQPPPFDLQFGDAESHRSLNLELPITIGARSAAGCPDCLEGGVPRPEFVDAAQDLYDGAIAYTDDRIGALIGRLRELEIYDDTVIAVVADHGELIYDRDGIWGHGGDNLTDDLVRVPLILKPAAGDRAPVGVTVSDQVRTSDLLPTLLMAAGLDGAAERSGSRDLWPLVAGDEQGSRVAFIENPWLGVAAVRTSDWKYVVKSQPGMAAAELLFDLRRDPQESTSVLAQQPPALGPLVEQLAGFLLDSRAGPFLLVVGDGRPGAFELRLEGGESARSRSWLGLTPRRGAAGAAADRPLVSGRILALAELELSDERPMRATLSAEGRVVTSRQATASTVLPWAEGTLHRLLELPAPAIYWLSGAPAVGGAPAEATTQVDQLEDLRVLGYIE